MYQNQSRKSKKYFIFILKFHIWHNITYLFTFYDNKWQSLEYQRESLFNNVKLDKHFLWNIQSTQSVKFPLLSNIMNHIVKSSNNTFFCFLPPSVLSSISLAFTSFFLTKSLIKRVIIVIFPVIEFLLKPIWTPSCSQKGPMN